MHGTQVLTVPAACGATHDLVCFPVTAVCRCYDTTDLQIVAEDALHQCGLKAVVFNQIVSHC